MDKNLPKFCERCGKPLHENYGDKYDAFTGIQIEHKLMALSCFCNYLRPTYIEVKV